MGNVEAQTRSLVKNWGHFKRGEDYYGPKCDTIDLKPDQS